MNDVKKKIEIRYALVQGLYWISACCLIGYATVFLISRGLNNTQIGIVTSVTAIMSIIIQLIVSGISDADGKIGLKRIIVTMYVIAISLGVVIDLIDVPVAMMIVTYTVASSTLNSEYGLINGMYVRYVNSGIPVDYGRPRAFGSIGYASIAYLLGVLVERFSADIILPLYIVTALAAVGAIVSLPKIGSKPVTAAHTAKGSYLQMLKNNRTLTLFLLASIISCIGQVGSATFLIRIIENIGGSTTELGIAMLIQSGAEIPMMLASRSLLKRFRSADLLLVSFTATALKILLLSVALSTTMIYLIMAISVLCYGIYGFASVIFISKIVAPDETVRGQSLVTLSYNGGIGTILGGIISGYLLDSYGLIFMLRCGALLAVMAALIMAVAIKSMRTDTAV